MRQIEFRGKSVKCDRWYYGNLQTNSIKQYMNKLKLLIARCLMSAMYDREKDLHPQDAFGLSLRLIEKEKSVFGLLKILIMVFLSIGLILFIWFLTIKPMKINAGISRV